MYNNTFNIAHDVGSGPGIFAAQLGKYFQRVHVSDTNKSFVEEARRRLDQGSTKVQHTASFSFSVTAAETAHEPLPIGGVDLITLLECIHWTRQAEVVKSIATSLATRGTLAVVQYNPVPLVVGNPDIDSAVRRMFHFWAETMLEVSGGVQSAMGALYLPQGNSGLESVPLLEESFVPEATKRIHINVYGKGASAFVMPGQDEMVAPSRARPQDARYEYTSDDAQGQGWRQIVDVSWFRGLIGTLEEEVRLPLYEPYLQEIEKLMSELLPDGKVTIEWPVSILLATRR